MFLLNVVCFYTFIYFSNVLLEIWPWSHPYSYCVKKQRNIPVLHSKMGLTFGWVLIHEGELFIRRVRKRKITRPICFRIKAGQILLRLWFLLLDTNTAFLGLSQIMPWLFLRKKLPTNHTNKERLAAASSCIETGILTLLFPAQTTAF